MSCSRCKGSGRHDHFVKEPDKIKLFANLSCNACGGRVEPERVTRQPESSRRLVSAEREQFYEKRGRVKHAYKR